MTSKSKVFTLTYGSNDILKPEFTYFTCCGLTNKAGSNFNSHAIFIKTQSLYMTVSSDSLGFGGTSNFFDFHDNNNKLVNLSTIVVPHKLELETRGVNKHRKHNRQDKTRLKVVEYLTKNGMRN